MRGAALQPSLASLRSISKRMKESSKARMHDASPQLSLSQELAGGEEGGDSDPDEDDFEAQMRALEAAL